MPGASQCKELFGHAGCELQLCGLPRVGWAVQKRGRYGCYHRSHCSSQGMLTGLLLTLGLHADELGEVQAQHLLSFSFLACKHSGVCQGKELK